MTSIPSKSPARGLQPKCPRLGTGAPLSSRLSPRAADTWGGGLNQIDMINKRANLGYWVRSSVTRGGGWPRQPSDGFEREDFGLPTLSGWRW